MGVTTFSSGGETTDWSLQLSVNLHVIYAASWQIAFLVKRGLVWHVMNSRRAKCKELVLERHTLFNNAFKVKNEALKADQKFSQFYTLQCFVKASAGFEMNH